MRRAAHLICLLGFQLIEDLQRLLFGREAAHFGVVLPVETRARILGLRNGIVTKRRLGSLRDKSKFAPRWGCHNNWCPARSSGVNS
jgi:hypothetical protein